ncbi:MAG: transcriptional repressor [Nitrospirae bacterium]|nr:transcriptional repressor [Nitrospirota bacterium]
MVKAGLRLTGPRIAIYRIVTGEGVHPSAEEVYQMLSDEMPSLSRDTVYRTLGTFEEAGLVRKFPDGDGVFRYDGKMRFHHHFTCSRCRTIFDVGEDETGAVPVPETLRSRGTIESVRLEFRGVCLSCQTRGGKMTKERTINSGEI